MIPDFRLKFPITGFLSFHYLKTFRLVFDFLSSQKRIQTKKKLKEIRKKETQTKTQIRIIGHFTKYQLGRNIIKQGGNRGGGGGY